jgi:hypothetical protein
MALSFEKLSGRWSASDGKYTVEYVGQRVGQKFELCVNGRREIRLFAWLEERLTTEHDRSAVTDLVADKVAIWKLDVSEAVASQSIGLLTIGQIFADFFRAYQFYGSGQRVDGEMRRAIVETQFVPGIEMEAWKRWGP